MTDALPGQTAATRFHYMDNLRAIAMLLGVVFHAALAYAPLMQNLWFVTDENSSAALDVVSYFLHLFRMPLFFLISGFFALMLIEKRGVSGFIKNRSLRILLPLVIFIPVMLACFMAIISWAMSDPATQTPLLRYMVSAAQDPNGPPPEFNTMHLWFLYNLLLFCGVLVVLFHTRLFQWPWLTSLLGARFILLVMPLLLVPALLTQMAPHPAPGKLTPELWSFGFYGVFFLVGSLLFGKQGLLDTLSPYKNVMLLVSVTAYGGFYLQLPASITLEYAEQAIGGIAFSWPHLLTTMLEAVVAVYMTFYCLIIGRDFLNRQHWLFSLVADSSYWIYLSHIPVLLVLQYWLMPLSMSLWLKFGLSTAGTLLIGMLSYLVLVRSTPLGLLLNGKRHKITQ